MMEFYTFSLDGSSSGYNNARYVWLAYYKLPLIDVLGIVVWST